jgi:hypothetical protein
MWSSDGVSYAYELVLSCTKLWDYICLMLVCYVILCCHAVKQSYVQHIICSMNYVHELICT